MKKAKICILIPYFGKFPKWFNLYLYSCSHINKIDFYYFTDCKIPKRTYSNTFFIKMTFVEYCNLVSEKLGINFKPSNPYFLVNLKPFLGSIHTNITKNYEFWGYSDIDLLYGNMSKIINDNNLNKYDLITTHSERVAGHFTIIRKGSKYEKLAFKIKNWRTRVSNETNYLDESDFSNLVFPPFILLRKLWRHFFNKFISKQNMYYFYQKMHIIFKSKALFIESYTSPVPKNNDIWIYNLSNSTLIAPHRFYKKIFLGNNPLPYLHFLFFKKTPYLKTKNYWRSGFYQIPSNYNFKKGGKILISNNAIRLLYTK